MMVMGLEGVGKSATSVSPSHCKTALLTLHVRFQIMI